MSRYAAAPHRRLDQAFAEAMSRDGGDVLGHSHALLPSSKRLRDVRSMQNTKVLLMQLTERTSAKGRRYLSGWMAKASVVAFQGDPDERGNPTWLLYVSEPAPRPGQGSQAREGMTAGRAAPAAAGARPGGRREDDMGLDDAIPF